MLNKYEKRFIFKTEFLLTVYIFCGLLIYYCLKGLSIEGGLLYNIALFTFPPIYIYSGGKMVCLFVYRFNQRKD